MLRRYRGDMKTRRKPPLVEVAQAVAHITSDDAVRIWTEPLFLSPDQAGVLVEGPYVSTGANSVGRNAWSGSDYSAELSWIIVAVGFIAAEAMQALDEAIDVLRQDIQAGRTTPGTHLMRSEPDPFGRNEATLMSFWRMKLSELEQS